MKGKNYNVFWNLLLEPQLELSHIKKININCSAEIVAALDNFTHRRWL